MVLIVIIIYILCVIIFGKTCCIPYLDIDQYYYCFNIHGHLFEQIACKIPKCIFFVSEFSITRRKGKI